MMMDGLMEHIWVMELIVMDVRNRLKLETRFNSLDKDLLDYQMLKIHSLAVDYIII